MADLHIIIADSEIHTSRLLEKVMLSYSFVTNCIVTDPINLISKISEETNLIIIDPFSVNLEFTSQLIFKIRRESPLITFLLFTDFHNVENTQYFYHGERKRFLQYFKLNKRTPLFLFESELINALFLCQNDLKNQDDQNGKAQKKNHDSKFIEIAMEVKNLIANDKTNEALLKLNVYFKSKDIDTHNQIVLLLHKLNNAEKNKTIDTIKFSEYVLMKQQVASGTLDVINKQFLII
jgi:Effector-associated domain 11